jgi:hypothetical protein
LSIICFLLDSTIDWAATGAMIGEVGSVVSTITLVLGHIYQTRKLHKIEDANTEKECRISLFDKHYEVYDFFLTHQMTE